MKRVDSEDAIWEECTIEQWDNLLDVDREIINFGDGFVLARRVKGED